MAKGAPTLSQQAQAQAATEYKSASQPILDQIAQEQQYALQKAQFVQGLSRALQQLMGQIAPQVQQDYTSAANTQAGIAKGYSDAIQSKIGDSANANSSFLTSLGAPAGAIKAAPDVGDVTFGMGGAIPAEALNQQGAAWTAYANMLPADAALRGQQDATNALGASNADILKLRNTLAEMAGKQPQVYRQILDALVSQNQGQQRINQGQERIGLEAQNNAFDRKYKINEQKIQVARLNAETQHWSNMEAISRARLATSQAAKANKQPKIDTSVSNMLGYLADSSGNAILGKGGKPIYTNTLPGNVKKILPALDASIGNAIKKGTDAQTAYQAIIQANPTAPQTVVKQEIIRLYGPDKVPGWMMPRPAGEPPLPDMGSWAGHAHLPAAQQQFSAFVVNNAKKYGVDPRAVLAVSRQEGFGGGIGDNNTSFGPFQLHIGGALPGWVAARGADFAERWAWSPQGWDYALSRISKVARGLTGQAAVDAIVRSFERPKNPGRESAGAMSAYGQPLA